MNGSRAVWTRSAISPTPARAAATYIVNIWRGMMGDPLKNLVDASVSVWLR